MIVPQNCRARRTHRFERRDRHALRFGLTLATVLSLLLSFGAQAQVASYPLDDDLADIANGYDASGSGAFTFEVEGERRFVSLGEDGRIALPAAVSEGIAASRSFEIAFDFRIPGVDDVSDQFYPVRLFAAIVDDFPLLRLDMIHFPGFTPEETYLVITYSDAVGHSDGTYLTETPDANLDLWRRFSLRFDLDKGLLVLSIGDDITIVRELVDGFDDVAFLNGILGSELAFLGLDNRDPADNPDLQLDELKIFAPAPAVDANLIVAFEALTLDLTGAAPLEDAEADAFSRLINRDLYLADYATVRSSLLAFTETFERLRPPLYEDGIERTFDELSPHERALQLAQGYLFETRFVPGDLADVAGVVFEHHEVIPGAVPAATPRIPSGEVEVNGSYHRDIAAELTDQSRVVRPTGFYLAPGDLVTIRAPQAVIDAGLSIVVGHHFRTQDYDYIERISRFPDISAEYPLDASEITVANPFGGGIYLKVPEGTDAGWFTLTVENAIASPYFSWRAGRRTDVAAWLAAVAESGAPWADFESDKMMFTVPTDELADVTRPDAIMARWDAIMNAIRLVGGRPSKRPRAEYYTFDTRLVTPAYGAGYPMVIPIREAFRGTPEDGWNPLAVLEHRPGQILLHEMGHNHLQPTMTYGGDLSPCHFLEAETIVHMLATSVYSNVYGLSIDEAFRQSAYQFLSFEQAAVDWMLSSNFRNNERMYLDPAAPLEESEQLRYQHRGHAKYADVARLFGWEGISAVNARFYTPNEEQTSTVCDFRGYVVGRDEYIRQASAALGVNMTPLFHFWGINPSPELAREMEAYPPSEKIRDLLIHYRDDVAPKTLEDYLVYHEQFPEQDYQYPRYVQYLEEFDAEFAAEIQAQFDFLLATYFPDASNGTLSGPWFSAGQAGHGWFIEQLGPATGSAFDRINAYWYVYLSGDPVWLIGQGELIDGQAVLDVFQTAGADFPPAFDSDDVELIPWGTLTFEFDGAGTGTASWSSLLAAFGSGSLGMQQIAPISSGAEACLSGSYYNAEQSGHGFVVQVVDVGGEPQALVAWYVYRDGAQVWLLGQAPLVDGEATVPLAAFRGGAFPPQFDPAAVMSSPWGTLTLRFVDGGIEASWTTTAEGYADGALSLQRLTQLEGTCD